MKRWILAVMVALAVQAAAMPASAAIQEMRVLAVGVDDSSRKAEDKALDYARNRAVYLAARKLGLPNAHEQVSKFTPAQFREIIRGTRVVRTRREGTITYSEINVTLVDEALRRALKLPPAENTAPEVKMRGVLLLSVYVGHERAYLWEKENALREPLVTEIRRQARGGILLPGGNLQDLRLIDYQNALTVTPEELMPMFSRYGAEEIIVAVLTPGAAGTMDAANVLLRRLRPDGVRSELLEIMPEDSSETSAMRLEKAAAAIAQAVTSIATATAEGEQAIQQDATQIPVRFAYTVPKEFARMQEAIRHAPGVIFLDLPRIALAQVDGTIYLKGDGEGLKQALTKQGVIVTVTAAGWRLSVR